MSRKKQFSVKQKQRIKRRKRRTKLREENRNPDEYFYGKFYVGR